MKNLILFGLLVFSIGTFSLAQNNHTNTSTPKLIVLINTADWCPACKANGERVEKQVMMEYMNNASYQIVMNDLSNDKTKAMSKESCDKAGISAIAKANKATGVIYFIHADSKKLLSKISVTKSTEEIKKAFEDAMGKI